MTVLTSATKVRKLDGAFAQLVKELMETGDAKQAQASLNVFSKLDIESKVKLFDILTKPD